DPEWEYLDNQGPRELPRQRTLVDWRSVCYPCFLARHIGFAYSQGLRVQAQRQLMEVNGSTGMEVGMHIDIAYDLWRGRSRYRWMSVIPLESWEPWSERNQ